MSAHPSDPGMDHLGGCMLTPCSVCGGWHSHRCDPPEACGRGAHQAAPGSVRHVPQDRYELGKDES